MLDALFVTPAAAAIIEVLGSAKADGRLAVIGNARLAKALGASRDVIPVAVSARAARKLPSAIPDLTSLASASLAAVIGFDDRGIYPASSPERPNELTGDLASTPNWPAALRGWARVVRDGGAIVFVGRGHPHEASRRALCGGLTEIEQRRAGRLIITSGLVSHLGDALPA